MRSRKPAPELKSPLHGVQVRVARLQLTEQSEFAAHTPQKPVTLQLGAPAGQANAVPEPLLPSHCTQDPAPGPAGTQTGALAVGQALVLPLPKLPLQAGMQTFFDGPRLQPAGMLLQLDALLVEHSPQTSLTGSHTGVGAAQSELLMQQTEEVLALSDATKLMISCWDQAPPVDPVNPM